MPMTMRDRMLAVFRGGDLDRVPFIQYDHNADRNEAIWAELGRDSLGILRWCGASRLETPDCRVESQELTQDGLRGVRNTLITPAGRLSELKLFDPVLHTAATREHYVKTPADYRVLLAYLRNARVVPDFAGIEKAYAELGADGLPLLAVGRTPYQQLWVQWVCLEDLCLHLADEPDLMAEVTDTLGQVWRRGAEAAAEAARRFDLIFVDVPDNITAPVIGETLFRRHCVPYYRELAALLAGTRTALIVHMDGDLKPLARAIAESPVQGLDSFSPQPDNDTTVAEALRFWPSMRLMINFPSSVHLAPPDRVYDQAMRMLQEGGHTRQLWIQVSENVPPGRWRVSYPAIARALRDFGRP